MIDLLFKQTERKIDRKKDTEKERYRGGKIQRNKDTEKERFRERKIDRQRDRQKDRVRWIDR